MKRSLYDLSKTSLPSASPLKSPHNMNQKLLLLFLFVLAFGALNAQVTCEPDTVGLPADFLINPLPYSVEGNPMGGIRTAAVVGEPYEFVVTFQTPATFDVGGIGSFDVNSIDLATEGALSNLPPSMDYVCNPPNCVFVKDSIGCLVVFGTPEMSEAGETSTTYDIGINTLVRTTLTDVPFSFPNTLFPGNYFLCVKANAEVPDCEFLLANNNDLAGRVAGMYNRPNPTSGLTEIVIESNESGRFLLSVSDMLGRQLHNQQLELIQGTNQFNFDASHLVDGMYIYTLSDGSARTSQKMMVRH